MKNSTIIALLLTFFMLLLVLSAAVVFLYQDRRQLQSDVDELHLDATVVAVQAQQTVADMAVQNAGVAAAATASHNALRNTRATQDALSARLATLEAVEPTPTASPAPTATPAQPFVTIVSPEAGALLPAGEAVDVVAFAAHPAGIETVELLVDDEPQALAPSEGAYRVLTTASPLELDPGIHTLTVIITGADNQSSSASVDFTIRVPAEGEQGEEEGNGP
ncbi:MAG: Ig-like domain-containing protein [Candidatus Promineifilaceae bacterium]|nr:Ig-like domain-containing protein [Candidatus Promineifilaceae bacterium]